MYISFNILDNTKRDDVQRIYGLIMKEGAPDDIGGVSSFFFTGHSRRGSGALQSLFVTSHIDTSPGNDPQSSIPLSAMQGNGVYRLKFLHHHRLNN